MTTWSIVVPVKRLAAAKTRLRVGTRAERASLALAFAADTVAAALATPGVDQVLVVTDDDVAAAELAILGAVVVPDTPDAGLNPALVHGALAATELRPACAVAALSSDLPALRTGDLERALLSAALHPVSVVADQGGLGTTLFAALRVADFDPRFGPRSHADHRAHGAVEVLPEQPLTTLRRDVDTGVDLWDARRLGVGPRTAAALAALADPLEAPAAVLARPVEPTAAG